MVYDPTIGDPDSGIGCWDTVWGHSRRLELPDLRRPQEKLRSYREAVLKAAW